MWMPLAAALLSIGVTGPPVDPTIEFSQIDLSGHKNPWLAGPLQPMSFRGMVTLLLTALPRETLAEIGRKFARAAQPGSDDGMMPQLSVTLELLADELPGLDALADEPLVAVNPAASQTQIVNALKQELADWKRERQLPDRRDRSDRYHEYLRAWDLREGWRAGTYHRPEEKTLKETAKELALPLQTVHNHYASAFQLVIGHPYSPELWIRTLGCYKLSGLVSDELAAVSRRRPIQSKTTRDVPESVVSPSGADGARGRSAGLVGLAASNSKQDVVELLLDVKTLVDAGKSDDEIIAALELSPSAVEFISAVRAHAL